MWSTSDILGSGLLATDGSIGSIDDLLFDDHSWTIRWAVIDTGSWLSGRKVLLPPSSFGDSVTSDREFPVDLTRQKVKDSPGIATDAPVSNQMETDLYGYYGWRPYWSTGYMAPVSPAGAMLPPLGIGAPTPEQATNPATERKGNPHLRSVNEVTGYAIAATDDSIGQVKELLLDEDEWAVRYLVVDTGNWLPGKKVLVSPRWVREVSWTGEEIYVDLTRAQVKDSPEYDPDAAIGRDYETQLHRHYGVPPYWI